MKRLRKFLSAAWDRVDDYLFAIIAAPCAYVLLSYRMKGTVRRPFTTAMFRKIGVFPICTSYYEPLIRTDTLAHPLSDVRSLPGIDFDIEGQLAFLKLLQFAPELVEMDLTRESDDPTVFSMGNGGFGPGDADYLYQLIRTFKPRRILEIGSGHSTKIAAAALKRNAQETPGEYSLTCIEPYEVPWLERLQGVKVIRKLVEDCEIDWTKALGPGDLLFIDSSHIIRPQGDVLTEYLQILPSLPSGVFIQVHDIRTPRDYFHEWIVDEMRFWNEQYLFEAVVSNTARYKVIGALNYLWHGNYNELKQACPYLSPDDQPGSFYLQVR
jgi:hypothetical protein